MKIYDRANQKYVETEQFGGKILDFLYNKAFGRFLLLFITSPLFSKLIGIYYKSALSKFKIAGFIKRYQLDMKEYENAKYKNFDAFFKRRLKLENLRLMQAQIEKNTNILLSPASSKLSIYKISDELICDIKNTKYSIADLLADKELAAKYNGGLALVFRLSVDDYHRYAFAQSGRIALQRSIKGSLHTVSSFSDRYPVYIQNHRKYVVIEGENEIPMVQMEVGALMVGKIHNHIQAMAIKGFEKGYFALGGSTIILLFKKDTIELDADILELSETGVEIKLRYLEAIGKFKE